MSESADRKDPFLPFRFEVAFDDLDAGGFSDCSGLQMETEVFDYAEGGENRYMHKFPTRTKQSNITLKRGIVSRDLYDWYADIVKGKVKIKNATILVREPDGGVVTMEWQVKGAFPCKWSGPELDAKAQGKVAVESFELCHEGLERRV